jgi:lipopolysaccharide transport system permease protein
MHSQAEEGRLSGDRAWTYCNSAVASTGRGALLVQILRESFAARELAWHVFRRDFTARYRESLLGYLWAFVPPLMLAFTFTLAGRAAILNTSAAAVPYPLLVLVGTVLWQVFGEALNAPMAAVREAKPLLARIRFPYEALVVARLADVLFNLVLKSLLLVVALLFYEIPIRPATLLAAVPIGFLIALGTGIGLFLTPISAVYEDVVRAIALFLGVWFFLTPVMYEHAARGSLIDWANSFNPVTSLLVTAREAMTGAEYSMLPEFVIVAVATLLLLPIGLLFFRVGLAFAIERMGA